MKKVDCKLPVPGEFVKILSRIDNEAYPALRGIYL
jgi:hypothetical protein